MWFLSQLYSHDSYNCDSYNHTETNRDEEKQFFFQARKNTIEITNTHTHVRTHTRARTHTNTYTHTHTHTHTHTTPNTGSGPICGSQTHFYGSLNICFLHFVHNCYCSFKTISKNIPQKAYHKVNSLINQRNLRHSNELENKGLRSSE